MSQFDNLRDKATEFAEENPDKVEQGSDAVGDKLNDATGGKFEDQIQQGQDALSDQFGGGGEGEGQGQGEGQN